MKSWHLITHFSENPLHYILLYASRSSQLTFYMPHQKRYKPMPVCKHFVFVGVGKKSAYLQLFPIIEEKRPVSCKLCKKFKIFSSSEILISFVSNICCTHLICSTEHSIKCLPHIFRRTTNIHLNRSHKIPID